MFYPSTGCLSFVTFSSQFYHTAGTNVYALIGGAVIHLRISKPSLFNIQRYIQESSIPTQVESQFILVRKFHQRRYCITYTNPKAYDTFLSAMNGQKKTENIQMKRKLSDKLRCGIYCCREGIKRSDCGRLHRTAKHSITIISSLTCRYVAEAEL